MKISFPKFAPSILCYEDPPAIPPATPPATPPAGDPPAGDPPAGDGRTFSQDDVNKILADDKRKHQERYKQLEGSYQTILADKNLVSEQREQMEKDLSDLQASFRTKDQQAEFERKKAQESHDTELSTQTDRANKWESMYKDEKVLRSLQDAATGEDAFESSQIVSLLKPFTQLKDIEGTLTPMVDFQDVDEKTGDEIRTLRTPADAVKRMKDLPKRYGNLFLSNVVSGVGSGSGAAAVGTGEIDVAALTPAQYRKIRAEAPERLGLPTRRMR